MAAAASYATRQHASLAPQAPANLGDNSDLHREGYPRLAFFLSQHNRYLHLRRFSALAIRLLLYRQHRLTGLEKDLLHLENRDANLDPDFLKNFARIDAEYNTPDIIREKTQGRLYEKLQNEMKEYEEALLRFNRLAGKGYDAADLRDFQVSVDQNRLLGLDAAIWGSGLDPESHALDIYHVIDRSSPSTIGRFFRDKFVLWGRRFPGWLWVLLTCSRTRPDTFECRSFSERKIEAITLTIGNMMASLLIYAAVTSLYFTSGRASSIVGVIVISITITACSLLFRNQQFITMVATVCAVLVTLLLNDDSRQRQPIQAPPSSTHTVSATHRPFRA